jgi:TRAP-type transport system small permease protein
MSEENGRVPPASAPTPQPPPEPGNLDTGVDHVVVPVRIEEALGAAAMGLICLISFGNVVVRYATNYSFAFTEEFSVFLLVFMTFVGASAAFASNEHIRITFFLERMPPTLRLVCEIVTILATTLMFSLIVYYGAQVTFDEWYWGETSPGLGYPAWAYTIWLPLLCVAILLRVFGRAFARFRRRPPTPRGS